MCYALLAESCCIFKGLLDYLTSLGARALFTPQFTPHMARTWEEGQPRVHQKPRKHSCQVQRAVTVVVLSSIVVALSRKVDVGGKPFMTMPPSTRLSAGGLDPCAGINKTRAAHLALKDPCKDKPAKTPVL